MAGYFTLYLDTTPPNIQIISPSHAIINDTLNVRVVSNEELGDYQNFYAVDSEGKTHNLTFSKVSESEYFGVILFDDYPTGIVTLYAQVEDTVGNISNIATKDILLLHSSYFTTLRLKSDIATRIIEDDMKLRSVFLDISTMEIENTENINNMNMEGENKELVKINTKNLAREIKIKLDVI